MVQINIGTGQGITQAIRDKIGATNIKNSDLGTWQKVVAEVNNAQAKDKSIFKSGENNTTDTTKLDDNSTYHSNFVVDEGNIEIDDVVWSRIKALLTGKTETSVPAKETNPSNAPKQPENKNETSNGQTLVSKNNNAEILNKETFQTPKKYLSAGDLEQCKQMLHLEELPDGVSIAKENGQFLYFKDGKQISFQEVKNLGNSTETNEKVSQSELKNTSLGEYSKQWKRGIEYFYGSSGIEQMDAAEEAQKARYEFNQAKKQAKELKGTDKQQAEELLQNARINYDNRMYNAYWAFKNAGGTPKFKAEYFYKEYGNMAHKVSKYVDKFQNSEVNNS